MKTMTEIMEKALTTMIALLIVASAGTQIIKNESQVAKDCYNTLLVNQLTTKLDKGIWQIFLREANYYSFKIVCPDRLHIHSDGNKVVIEYLAFERWHADKRIYPISIRILKEPTRASTYLVSLSQGDRAVLVNFLEV